MKGRVLMAVHTGKQYLQELGWSCDPALVKSTEYLLEVLGNTWEPEKRYYHRLRSLINHFSYPAEIERVLTSAEETFRAELAAWRDAEHDRQYDELAAWQICLHEDEPICWGDYGIEIQALDVADEEIVHLRAQMYRDHDTEQLAAARCLQAIWEAVGRLHYKALTPEWNTPADLLKLGSDMLAARIDPNWSPEEHERKELLQLWDYVQRGEDPDENFDDAWYEKLRTYHEALDV